jgi:predicted dehydrogenase
VTKGKLIGGELAMVGPSKFAIVGSGWRAEFFARLARLLPERLTLVGAAVRRPESVEEVSQRWGTAVYLSPDELVSKQHPEFVITSIPRSVNPEVVAALVASGAPVLSETPPATDLEGMRKLWAEVGDSQLVQVAEQYLLLPGHAARLEVVKRGLIGQPTSAQVSSTHDYHAVSMMRGFVGAGYGPATVSAVRFSGPLSNPLLRDHWNEDDTPQPASTILATIDFGGSWGLYDFTDNQWHNQLRLRRVLVRGSLGEIEDDTVVRLAAPRTIIRSPLLRYQLGQDLNLDGHDTEHISFEGNVVWRNPFLGARLMDDEIAIASIMVATGAWARQEGAPPYPLARACQDHLIGLAMLEAAEKQAPVVTGVEPWADKE